MSGFVQDVGRKGAASVCISFELLRLKALVEGRAKRCHLFCLQKELKPLSSQLHPEGLSK